MDLEHDYAASGQYWTDIDSMDHGDPMACTEYVHDIVCHLLEAEVSRSCRSCRCCVGTHEQ